MATNASSGQESVVEKRAKYEAFEYRVPTEGAVRVENKSYGDESGEHVYVVSVEDRVTTECTCPADEHRPGKCKHRVAVENNAPVLIAASTVEKDPLGVRRGDTYDRTRLTNHP